MHQNSICVYHFFPTSVVPMMMFCVRSDRVDDTVLNSSCDELSDLLQQAEMNCNLILKTKTF